MSILSIIFLSLALATDAFAVSISAGILLPLPTNTKERKKKLLVSAVKVGIYFGAFQAAMPLIGWWASSNFSAYTEAFDHWIAFALLAGLGVKILYEAISKKSDEKEDAGVNPLKTKNMLVLALATSLDALAIGVSLALIGQPIITPAIIIGLITFVTSALGVLAGRKIGSLYQKGTEIAGGLILIAIGIKILMDHLLFF